MNKQRRWRLIAVLSLLFSVCAATALVLYALRQNMNLFYTPTQIVNGQAPKQHSIRLGGMVVKGSVKHAKDSLRVRFVLTDYKEQITVRYQGILPDLFREGQGIVTLGEINAKGDFVAARVFAKHDENYMPPEVKAALAKKVIV